jgi:hypothetical protein
LLLFASSNCGGSIACQCHTPRRRGIQYAAASKSHHWRLWNTGSPACAGDDGRA